MYLFMYLFIYVFILFIIGETFKCSCHKPCNSLPANNDILKSSTSFKRFLNNCYLLKLFKSYLLSLAYCSINVSPGGM